MRKSGSYYGFVVCNVLVMMIQTCSGCVGLSMRLLC